MIATLLLPSRQKAAWVAVAVISALLAAGAFLYSQSEVQVGYASLTPDQASASPGATALFSYRENGVLLWQAGVAAVEPIARGRLFVDQSGGTRSALAVVNTGNDNGALLLTLRSSTGQTVDTLDRQFGPGEHVPLFVDELFEDFFAGGAGDFVGSLEFEGSAGADARWAAVTLRQSANQFNQPIFATLPVVPEPGDSPQQANDSDAILFPQVGAGSGLSTQLILLNPTAVENRGRIQLFASDGSPLELTLDGVTATEFPYQIPPQGIFRGQFTRAAGVGVGYAVVELEEGLAPPDGAAVFQFTTGTAVISEAGVLAAPLSRRVRMFVDNAGTRTGLALALPSPTSADVELRLLDSEGRPIQSRSVTLPSRGHISIFADEVFDDLPQGFTGILEVSSPEPIAAVTLKLSTNEVGQSVLTTLPVLDLDGEPPAGTRYFPQIGFGQGFSTRLIFLDFVDQADSLGTLSFFSSSGVPLQLPLGGETAASFPYEIPDEGVRQRYPGVVAEAAEILVDSNNLTINEGSTIPLSPIVLDELGQPRDDFNLQYESLSPGTVEVDQAGNMTALNRGFSTVLIGTGAILRSFTVTSGTITGGQSGFRPSDVAQDFSGRVFLANSIDHTILEAEDFTGNASVYAGVTALAGLQNGPRLNSRFRGPAFLALDLGSGGDLYVSDSSNHVIRRVGGGTSGQVSTLAGSGAAGSGDGIGTAARFRAPKGIALDDRGRLWVADSDNHSIRRINLATREVSTVAGLAGVAGLADGVGAQARFNSPQGIVFESETIVQQLLREQTGEPPPPVSVIVADTGNGLLRRVREDGRVETLGAATLTAGLSGLAYQSSPPFQFNDPAGLALDPFGNIYVSEQGSGDVKVILNNGETRLAAERGTFANPGGMAITIKGRILVAEELQTVQQIRYAGPGIGSVEPQTIPSSGGVQVTVRGQNFAPESIVIIGDRVITQIDFKDTTEISFQAPPLPSGIQTVTLQHRGGLGQASLEVLPPSVADLQAGSITTIAGGTTYVGDGLLATAATLRSPTSVAGDAGGAIYIADSGLHRVRRVAPVSDIITTVAGAGFPGDTDASLPGPLSALNHPSAVALDPSGGLLIADRNSHRLRRLDFESGLLETVMGDGTAGLSSDGLPAAESRLNAPSGVAIDSEGTIWVSDSGNHRVIRIDADSTVVTVTGDGVAGFSGDGGPAEQARVNAPAGLALVGDILIVADTGNHRIRTVDSVGIIQTIAGDGNAGFGGDSGPAVAAGLNAPLGAAVDLDGNLLIADTGNHRIRRVDLATGLITTFAGNGSPGFGGDGGAASAASLFLPADVAVDGTGNLLIADAGNRRVRRVSATASTIATVAGTGLDNNGDGGSAALASLDSPAGLAIWNDQLVISEAGAHRLRGLTGSYANARPPIETLAGSGLAGDQDDPSNPLEARFNEPTGIVQESAGSLLVADRSNHKLRRVVGTTAVTTVAGNGEPGYLDDVPAADARLNLPDSVVRDPGGGYLFADSGNHRIRKLDNAGFISIIAGTGVPGYGGDGGRPSQAQLNAPTGLAVDDAGRIYFCDQNNHRVRVIDRTLSEVHLVAGSGEAGDSGDGGDAVLARLDSPSGLALDGQGRLYIADTGNRRIRVVDLATGTIQTLAGGTGSSLGDGSHAGQAVFLSPVQLLFDSDGNLLISDRGHHRVRLIRSPAP